MEAYAKPVENPFVASAQLFSEIVVGMESPDAFVLSQAALERRLDERGTLLMRQLLQDHLDLRARRELLVRVVGSDGEERTHARGRAIGVTTIFGDVAVKRLSYGARGIASLAPQDAGLNLADDRYSLEVRRRVAEEAAKGSFAEAIASRALGGAHVPQRQAEQLVARAAEDFDAFYLAREEAALHGEGPAASDSIVVISTDGKGIAMRKRDLREQTRRRAERAPKHKRSKRLSKGEKRNRKRMATVATVYMIDPFVRTAEDVVSELRPVRDAVAARRPRPQDKRVWASVIREPIDVIDDAFREALRRDITASKPFVALVDGNEAQLAAMVATGAKYEIEITIVLDLMHALTYLWTASYAFHPEGTAESQEWVTKRLRAMLEGKVSAVAAGMRRSATLRKLRGSKRRAVDRCANYFLKYAPYMRYDEYLARGFPIASGVIEGACRHLIKDRMDLTGARWTVVGAEAVLRLRALRSSHDFEEYWLFHEARHHERVYEAAYSDGHIPNCNPLPINKPRLRIVN